MVKELWMHLTSLLYFKKIFEGKQTPSLLPFRSAEVFVMGNIAAVQALLTQSKIVNFQASFILELLKMNKLKSSSWSK